MNDVAWLKVGEVRHWIKGPHFGIGRETGQSLVMANASVSRKHAQLISSNGAFWLWDLDSQNGTWRNGVRVTQPVALQSGDTLRFGDVSAIFVLESAEVGATRFAGGSSALPENEPARSVEDE